MKICLVTTTFYQNVSDVRFGLALKTCQAAREAGYQIHIVDGSSNPEISSLLRQAGANVEAEKVKGMGASRRQCFKMGLDSGADVIVWLEPEKGPFVPLIGPCVEMVGECDIVFPGRMDLVSYPRYQQLSEHRAMWKIGWLTSRPDIDWMFGPRVLSRKGAELLMSYDGSCGDTWHILVIPVLWALMNGVKVGSKLVNYIHPAEQTAAEEGDEEMDRKRDHQRKVLEEAVETEMMLLRQQQLDHKM
ncbi:MAG: hypothetical protein RL536_632 [Candidatus Parcubacteria bacterium]